MTLTNFYNRRKHNAEIQKILLEGKGSEAANMEAIFQNYNLALTQTKIELADVNKRFTDYIENATRRDIVYKTRITKLEKDNKELSDKVYTLTSTLNTIQREQTVLKNTYEDDNNNSMD